MASPKPRVGKKIMPLRLANVERGHTTVGGPRDRWTVLFVYRGHHCPRCKKYLNKLSSKIRSWKEHMDVIVVSADTKEKAIADRDEFSWKFDLCYGLSKTDMRELGLYMSEPLSESETDSIFAEPGMFAFKPDGTLMLADISNGPAARPDLTELLDGMKFNIENDRPVRGTA